ncbi:MAG: hypothetical protein LBU87_03665, partial [Lactobacillales bacterium]|jgi:hypothetical protein|nr:hypothetical protein [Lactobacillales bacterium]
LTARTKVDYDNNRLKPGPFIGGKDIPLTIIACPLTGKMAVNPEKYDQKQGAHKLGIIIDFIRASYMNTITNSDDYGALFQAVRFDFDHFRKQAMERKNADKGKVSDFLARAMAPTGPAPKPKTNLGTQLSAAAKAAKGNTVPFATQTGRKRAG